MIRDFIKEGTVYTLAGFLAKGVSLLLIPVFTAYFTPVDYGVLDLLYVFSMFFNALFSFQLGQGLIRYMGESHEDKDMLKRLASSAFIFILVAYTAGALIALVFREPIMNLLGIPFQNYEKSYFLAVISIVLNGVFFFMSGHLQALRRKTEFAIASFLHALLGILSTYFFVIILDKCVNGVFYATIAIVPIVILYQFICLRKEYGLIFHQSLMKKLLKYSLPLIPAAVAYVLLSLTDRIFISYYLSKAELGIYSVGFKFSFAVSIVISGFSMALGPILYQRYHKEQTSNELAILLNWFIVIGLFVVSSMSIFADETVYIFTQRPYYPASDVLPLLYFSVWFAGLAMFSPGMNLMKKTKWIACVVSIAALINVALNALLIPKIGIKGAALATLISSMINYSVLFYLSFKLFRYKINLTLLLLSGFITLLSVAFTTSTRLALDLGEHVIFFKVLIVLSLCAGLIAVIRLKPSWFFYSKLNPSQLHNAC